MLKQFKFYLKPLLVLSLILGGGYYWKQTHSNSTERNNSFIVEHPIYGNVTLTNPLEIEVLASPAMERLKRIHQYGVTYYAGLPYFFSRYDHSVGVFLLLKKYGLSQNEQIAGILHDASHTAFSHVAEVVFNHTDHHHSYQDTIHRACLEAQGIGEILQKYNITISDIMHKETDPAFSGNGIFKALECDLPDLCADRIDYILEGSVYEQMLTREDVQDILAALQWNGTTWFFTNPIMAKKFAECSLYLTENVFSGILNAVTYHWAAIAIRRAFELGVISKEEFCTSVDALIWEKLETSTDPLISEMVHKIINWEEYCELGNAQHHDLYSVSKFRGVNPLVFVDNQLIRLTDISTEFAEVYHATKERMAQGKYITFKEPKTVDLGK